MSAVAALSSSVLVSSRRISELDATREISRIAASGYDVAGVVDSIALLALKVGGVKRVQVEYVDPVDGTSVEPFVWGSSCNEAVGSAIVSISAGGQSWGELRLYFELQPTTLESPLRFAKFLAQQIGLQLSRWFLSRRAGALRERIQKLRRIVEKRKAIQRARAIVANTRQIEDAQALQVMRQFSRESRRTLHEVAEAIIFGDAKKWTSGGRYVERGRSLRLLDREAARH